MTVLLGARMLYTLSCPAIVLSRQRSSLLCTMLLAVSLSLSSPAARAECTCICVDGLNRPLCSEVTDIEPVCPPKVCPGTPSTKPLEPYRLPPYDSGKCSMKYLYNKYAERYEWRQVCE